MKFTAIVIPSGNATGVEVPERIMKSLGTETRPPVSITINGHTWRSRVARMRGQCLIGISAANRAASGIAEGESVQVELQLDAEPREVSLPSDMTAAFAVDAGAGAAFDRQPFGLKRKHLASIEGAKSAETRARRIAKLVESLKSPNAADRDLANAGHVREAIEPPDRVKAANRLAALGGTAPRMKAIPRRKPLSS